jgi:hypothetical protein
VRALHAGAVPLNVSDACSEQAERCCWAWEILDYGMVAGRFDVAVDMVTLVAFPDKIAYAEIVWFFDQPTGGCVSVKPDVVGFDEQ